MKHILLIGLGALIIYTLGHASGPDDRDLAWVEYCEMHSLYKATGGESGWPDYKGTYEEDCK